jgi:hypothetical protein
MSGLTSPFPRRDYLCIMGFLAVFAPPVCASIAAFFLTRR